MPATRIRDAIEKTASFITEHPEKAQAKNAPARARVLDGLRCEVTGPKGETVHTDMPPALGGSASAPNPGWLLRASLAACTATTIAMRAATLGVALAELDVTVDSSSDTRGILGLDDGISAGLFSLAIHVRIGATDVAPDRLRALADWGDRHSPVGCTARIAPGYALDIEVV